jgi:hypothetical protein
VAVLTPACREELHRRGLRLEWFTVAWNVVETWVCAYLSVALLAVVGLNAAFGWWWADPMRRVPVY